LKEFLSPLGNFKNVRPLFEKFGNPPLIPIFVCSNFFSLLEKLVIREYITLFLYFFILCIISLVSPIHVFLVQYYLSAVIESFRRDFLANVIA
jgi:hypothetical protein